MIVLGFDPGAWIGYALVDMEPRLPVVIQAGKIRYERQGVELSGSEVIEQAIGKERTPRLIGVEKVVAVYPRQGFSTPMATALANATRIEGRILEASKHKSIESGVCTARDWRYALTGLIAPSDAVVKSVLSRRVEGVVRMSAHARDAIGVAIYCGIRLKTEQSIVKSKRFDTSS